MDGGGDVVWEGDIEEVDALYERYDVGRYARGLIVDGGEAKVLQRVSDDFVKMYFLDK